MASPDTVAKHGRELKHSLVGTKKEEDGGKRKDAITVAKYGRELKHSLVGTKKEEDGGKRKDAITARDKKREELNEAQSNVKKYIEEVAKYEQEAKAIRQRLGLIPTTADGPDLIDRLEVILSLMTTSQASLLEAQEEAAKNKANLDVAQRRMDAIMAMLSVANEYEKKGEEWEKERKSLHDLLEKKPLASLKTAAKTALTGSVHDDADQRIKADIPDILLKRAQNRRNAEVTRQSDLIKQMGQVEEGLIAQLASDGDRMAKFHQAEREFQRAQEALRHYVTTGSEQFDRAMSLLKQVADRTHATLTGEQRRRIEGKKPDATADAALQSKRGKALAKEALLTKQGDEAAEMEGKYQDEVLTALKGKNVSDEKNAALEAARKVLEGVQGDYRKARRETWRVTETLLKKATENTVIEERDYAAKVKSAEASGGRRPSPHAVEEARKKESDARRNYQESPLGVLHAWEGAVPDTTWQLFDQFEEANKILKDLESKEPSKLETDWEKAEENYVTALLESDTASTIRRGFEDEIVRQTARVKALEQSANSRRFSAMRGD